MTEYATTPSYTVPATTPQEERKVIFASSLGTVFEWYDFFLYGALAAVISKQFFAGVNDTTAFIFALMAFAAGFLVRPFGALVFGRLGDMIGRRHLPGDHPVDGVVDLRCRPAAHLCLDRGRRADHPGHLAHASGPGPGRRVRRRGDLCRRARPGEQAR